MILSLILTVVIALTIVPARLTVPQARAVELNAHLVAFASDRADFWLARFLFQQIIIFLFLLLNFSLFRPHLRPQFSAF